MEFEIPTDDETEQYEMKALNEVKQQISKYGYKKNGNSFWKIENGFYKLIHFQAGAYGDYFFINVALHPDGFPMLYTKQLEITKRPKESQCILRQRVERISDKANTFPHKIGFIGDVENMQILLATIMPDIELWMNKWGNWETILSSGFEEISNMFSAAPLVWKKEFFLLKSYCALAVGKCTEANKNFSAYIKENPDMDFSLVDNYMLELINSHLSVKKKQR